MHIRGCFCLSGKEDNATQFNPGHFNTTFNSIHLLLLI
jgi:hypothetical protein